MIKQLYDNLGRIYRNIIFSGTNLGIATILPSGSQTQLYEISEILKCVSYLLAAIASAFAIILSFYKIKKIRKDEKVAE